MKLSIIFLLIIFSLICYSVCAIPKSKEEQKQDDEAQLEWIKEHNKANKVDRQALKVDKKIKSRILEHYEVQLVNKDVQSSGNACD